MGYGYIQGQNVSKESFEQKKKGKMQVRCLEKSYDITELQDFKLLEDTIFYTEVFNPEVASKMVFSTEISSASTRKTKIFYFHILQITNCSK